MSTLAICPHCNIAAPKHDDGSCSNCVATTPSSAPPPRPDVWEMFLGALSFAQHHHGCNTLKVSKEAYPFPACSCGLDSLRARAEAAPQSQPCELQIKKLADFIMDNIPGEPSQSESAVDCAIRLLTALALKGDDPDECENCEQLIPSGTGGYTADDVHLCWQCMREMAEECANCKHEKVEQPFASEPPSCTVCGLENPPLPAPPSPDPQPGEQEEKQ